MGTRRRLFRPRGGAAQAEEAEPTSSQSSEWPIGSQAPSQLVTSGSGTPAEDLPPRVAAVFGLGDLIFEELITPVANLIPSPRHPRRNWATPSKDLSALAQQVADTRGLLEPIYCTRAGQDPASALRIVDGHRRYAAARAAPLTDVRVVMLTHSGGRPLDPWEQLTFWLIVTHAHKRPSKQQTIVGIVIWYQEWARRRDAGEIARDLTQDEIAQYLHVSVGAVNWAARIATEPTLIVAAVVAQDLPITAAIKLMDAVPDREHRTAIVETVPRENQLRHEQGRRRYSVDEIMTLANAGPTASADHRTMHPPAARHQSESIVPQADSWLGFQSVRLRQEQPQASDVAKFVALTRDACACYRTLKDARTPHVRNILHSTFAALSRPGIERALDALLAHHQT